MNSSNVYTSIEPIVVDIVSIHTESYNLPFSVAELFTWLATSTMTRVTATATDSPSSVPTCTINFQLPAHLNSPLADGQHWTHTLSILILVAIVLFGVTLLSATSYFIFIVFHCRCPKCPFYKDKLGKWKRHDIEHATQTVVRENLQELGLEKGRGDLQLKVEKDRMKALASLEGQPSVTRSAIREEGAEEKTRHLSKYAQIDDWPHKAPPAHIGAAVADTRRYNKRTGETHMVDKSIAHPATYSAYVCDFVAPCETENQRTLQEAEEDIFTRPCHTMNPAYRGHVLQATTDRVQEVTKTQIETQETIKSPSTLSMYLQECLEKNKAKEDEQILELVTYQTPSPR